MNKLSVYFRSILEQEDELLACKSFFSTYHNRVGIKDSLVIGRYSVLPFYKELEEDLKLQNSKLINSYLQHSFIANFDWYEHLKHLTPKSYFSLQDIVSLSGPFVLKGKTNSRKQHWNKLMFANDYKEAANIYVELLNDALIQDQGVVIRDYVELENFGIGINGQPFANEWRCFFYKNKLLSKGFYWTTSDFIPDDSVFDNNAMHLALSAAEIISNFANFFVIDIAKTKTGEWIVIEVNDGCMSGLSGNDPFVLYKNLQESLLKDNFNV